MRGLIDLHFRGFERAIGIHVVDTDDGPALVDCGPTTTLPALRAGLEGLGLPLGEIRHLLLSHIHLDHAGGAGTLVREQPDLTVWVAEVGARHLVEPSRLEASARRVYGAAFDGLFGVLEPVPEANVAVAQGDVLGWEAFAAPGHAAHHVAYLRDGVLLAGDACGVRRGPGEAVLPFSPPPDIDVELWQATIAAIAAREPAVLALTHYGVVEDVPAHLRLLSDELDRWHGLVAGGADEAEFVAATTPTGPDSGVYAEISPLRLSWLGLRRYLDTRTDAVAPRPT